MEKDTKQRLNLQRQEYESTIQRHLSFIDQLIDDKKILSERCEELVKKLKETDKKYVDKISKMEEKWVCDEELFFLVLETIFFFSWNSTFVIIVDVVEILFFCKILRNVYLGFEHTTWSVTLYFEGKQSKSSKSREMKLKIPF